MRRPKNAVLGATLVSTLLVLSACGSGATTAKPVAKIVLTSPAFTGDALPARYTCDGQNISPPLEWGSVPADVGGLALFVVAFKPDAATKAYKVSVEWAVAGVSPALHRLAAGQVPPGAYVDVNASGKRQRYSVCPKRGTTVQYQFELYGVPTSEGVSRDFSAPPVFDALTTLGSSTRAIAHGAFVAIYKRPA